MATVVQDTESGRRYVLIGAGYGMFKSARPGALGDLFPKEDKGNVSVLAVCNAEGHVG